MNKAYLFLLALVVVLASCSKEIEVALPEGDQKLVVEGTIELGGPPFVILTRTQSFFAPTDLNSIANIFVQGATITVSDGNNSVVLDQICSSSIPDSLIPAAAELVGLDPELLAQADICVYTNLNQSMLGQVGVTYSLRIEYENELLTSASTLPPPVKLDSLWFRLAEQDPLNDTSGYIWARLSDPPGVPNYYRWLTRRISHDEDGEVEDATFAAPLGSAFNDQFFDGLSLDFFGTKGNAPFSDEQSSFFTRNDTVVIKFVNFGPKEYDFYRSFENNVASQGDLFTSPANVKTNIEGGGLGVWAATAPVFDTVICIP